MIDFLATFIVFFAVIDPIGTVPVFIAVTRGYEGKAKRRIALLAAFVSTVVLVFFVVVGELILIEMAIPLAAFQIAGGIVLFLFALSMIFGVSKPEEESIASPGAMLAAVLLTENARFDLWQQVQTVLVMISVLIVTLILMLGASLIHRFIGDAGASVISRVMGLILSAVATTNVLTGLSGYFGL